MTVLPGEQCRKCDQQATRTLGTTALCQQCAESTLDPIRTAVDARLALPEGFDGRGRQTGPLRAEWGSGFADLTCDQCDAGWVGPPGEPCTWCNDRYHDVHERQRLLALEPPDNPSAYVEWGQRLKRAVDAGIITETDADHAWERARTRAA